MTEIFHILSAFHISFSSPNDPQNEDYTNLGIRHNVYAVELNGLLAVVNDSFLLDLNKQTWGLTQKLLAHEDEKNTFNVSYG